MQIAANILSKFVKVSLWNSVNQIASSGTNSRSNDTEILHVIQNAKESFVT
jgi:hypothetical protein